MREDSRADGARGPSPTTIRSATIYDVAERADVSPQTVSRVLRGFQGVRPATRERVMEALKELDYKPNEAARSLRTRRVNRIGALVHAMSSTGPGRTLEGAAMAARAHGYVLDIVPMDGEDPASIALAFSLAAEHQIAGIVATADTAAVRTTLAEQAGPVSVVWGATTSPEGFDMSHDEAIGALAADHLVELGHRDIAYVGGPESWAAATERARGFEARVLSRGARLVRTAMADWSADAGHAAASALLDAATGATALACGNDAIAIGALAAMSSRGVSAPTDLSVIGVDDIPEARYHLPSLTTIALDFEAEGAGLIERLLSDIGELEASEVTTPAPPRLVARESTAPVR